MPHGRHIYAKAYDTEKAKMCAYSQSYHALPHCKCALRCCSQCPSINITDQETDDKHPNRSPSIRFHIYHLIARCKKNGLLPLTNKKSFWECQHNNASRKSTKINKYKRAIDDGDKHFQISYKFLIPAIQKLTFHITHVKMLGTNHCDESRQTAFKRHK